MPRSFTDIANAMVIWGHVNKSQVMGLSEAIASLVKQITVNAPVNAIKTVGSKIKDFFDVLRFHTKFAVNPGSAKTPWKTILTGGQWYSRGYGTGGGSFSKEQMSEFAGAAPGRMTRMAAWMGRGMSRILSLFPAYRSANLASVMKQNPVLKTMSSIGHGVAWFGEKAKEGFKWIANTNTGKAVRNVGKAAGEWTKMSVKGPMLGGMMETLNGLMGVLLPFQSLFDAIGQGFQVLGSVMQGQLGRVVGAVIEWMTKPEVIAAIETLGAAFEQVFGALAPLGQGLVQSLVMVANMMAQFLTTLAPVIRAVAPILTPIILGPLVYGIWLTFNIIIGIIDAIIVIANSIITIGNFFTGKAWNEGHIPLLSLMALPEIPTMTMAEGGAGVVRKPTLFIAGEAGPESFAFGGAGNTGSVGGGNQPIIINNYGTIIGEAELIEKVERALAQKNYVLR